MTRTLTTLLAILTLALAATTSLGQTGTDTPAEAAEAEPVVVEDKFDRGTPRRAMRGFLEASEARDYQRAAAYLDLRFPLQRQTNVDGEQLARQLTLVLERELWIDLERLSDSPEGKSGDELPDYRDEVGQVKLGDEKVTLYLERVRRDDDGELIWKISRVTLNRVPELYAAYSYKPLIESIARAMPDGSFLGVELFKWVIALGSMLFGYIALLILSWIPLKIISKRGLPTYPKLKYLFRVPISLLIVNILGGLVLVELGIGTTAQRISRAHTLTTILSVWVLLSLIGLLADIIGRRMRAKGRESGAVFLRPIANSLKTLVVLVGFLVWLDNIGFNITTLLAGLGIGGLAVALALQKPLEDLFGAVSLFTQQPVRVNDFCKFGSHLGVVEEVGLRTTRIRTLNNTLVSVPNSRFAQEYIENITARQRIRYYTTLHISYEATKEQMTTILDKTRTLLAEHDRLVPDSHRARLKELDRFGMNIEVLAQVATTNWAEYLEIIEGINLSLVSIVHEAGATFAIPRDLDAPA